ncbi:hypothetical protein [Devosia ginsengisoli]|uniref:hypothetical protein n=1 Tax=Devosia ginsengisoli TaxID=400770 RepID=UPI0026F33CFB|nr:hypothetical protein [Devosia ginsengisoli]MCR6671352.1 hypothetical protein [Devosia ginsengisoli]
MYGPNTNTGPLVFMLEAQARYIARSLKPLQAGKASSVEVNPGINQWYQNWLQGRLAKTAWNAANNYFKSPSGKIVTQWPGDVTTYWVMTRLLRRFANTYRSGDVAPASAGSQTSESENKNAA